MDYKKYQEYRRIYPKLRLSWSLYKAWVKKDWQEVWSYLTGQQQSKSEYQIKGTTVHKWIEDNGWKKINGISKYLKQKSYKQEKIIEKERDHYIIVSRPDLYNNKVVVDWKTGKSSGYEQQLQLYMWVIGEKCVTGLLAEVKAKWKDEKIEEVDLYRVKQYEKSVYACDWEMRMDEMANDIELHIKYLDRYIKQT